MRRRMITFSVLALGIILIVVGYFSAAPWGADAVRNSDPRFAFAPTLFVLGVVIAVSSALVYELLPDEKGQ